LFVPLAMAGLVGVIARDISIAGFTVRLVVPEMLPDVALIVAEPAVTDVARPFEPAALLMVATAVLDELQVTDAVRFCVVLSEYVPVAVNCWLVPGPMLGLAGVTERETRVAGFTVRLVVAEMLPDAALIVVEPAATGVARPLDPAALLIVTAPVFDELQVTDAVRFCVVLSE
jgi:hypothetical protein